MKQLVVKYDSLCFPDGGFPSDSFEQKAGLPSILLCRYAAGDCDRIEWPIQAGFRGKLASALFDERECNPFFGGGDSVLLPDGEVFNIDLELMAYEAERREAAGEEAVSDFEEW